MTHSWDNPAKLGHPSQNGTTQPNWDSPPMWDVPHRVGRLNRLGRPMKEWDDPAVGHPTPSPGHTTQAGTSHTNWSIPFFSRLLSLVPGQVVSRFTLNPSSTRLKISVGTPTLCATTPVTGPVMTGLPSSGRPGADDTGHCTRRPGTYLARLRFCTRLCRAPSRTPDGFPDWCSPCYWRRVTKIRPSSHAAISR